ncbi:MAG TPA: hypothetical protein PKA53_00690 [Sphingobacterium sp.]|nr:hypothetical protein [Sphingobacterium sp.]
MSRNNTIYRERQNFLTWWLYLLLILVFTSGLYSGWYNIDTLKQADSLKDISWGLIVSVLICLLILLTRLHSRLDTEGIHVRFSPFMWKDKTWRWEDISEVYVKKYSPWEYGGWGYRLSGAGTAYSTKGNYGIQLVLKKRGRRILIGTQNPEEIKRVLTQFKLKDDATKN